MILLDKIDYQLSRNTNVCKKMKSVVVCKTKSTSVMEALFV